MNENWELPPYLATDGTGGGVSQPYGTLSYNRKRDCWVVKAEPEVTELCKRLFPGTDGSRRGEARFTAHRRIVGDLNWLMLRYPLTLKPQDAQRWHNALQDARAYAERRERAKEAPERVQPDATVFKGRLTPFQEEGLAFLLRDERCLLADEMGLGKTVQALAMLAQLRAFPAMLIAPAHLIRNWQSEIGRFIHHPDGNPMRVHVLKGLKPYALPPADLYLMHYLLLRGWKDELPSLGLRTVVFDEIQELRHSGTEKYSAASLLAGAANRVVGLSGTPIYNLGAEIWNVVNILDYHFLGDFESFTREWCYGYGNQIVAKPEQLGEYLRQEGLMLRRTKQQVLPELPPKRRLVIPIDRDDALYRKLMLPLQEKLLALKNDSMLSDAQRALLTLEVEQAERQATGLAKAPFVAQFVRALLEGGEKVLLFAHHHAVMDTYRQELRAFSPAFITGRETADRKEQSVERFMQGRTELCCVSLRAASGLNLQRATSVVFGELDWSPAVHSQAEDRAHRMGQTDSILCYYPVAPGGSDQEMQDALGLKVSQFVALMGDAPQPQAELNENTQFARLYAERLVQRLLMETV